MSRRYGYKKKNKRSTKRYKRKGYSFTNKVKNIVRHSMLEKKHSTPVPITDGLDTTGTVTHLTTISQGDNYDNRTGNRVNIQHCYIKGLIKLPASNTTGAWCRISLVQDLQQVGDTTPSYTDIYQSIQPDSSLKRENLGRFKVLNTRVFVMNHMVDTNDTKRKFVIYHKFKKPITCRYNGTASTDIQKNGLYLTLLSDIVNGANEPVPDFQANVSFTDA